MWSPHCTALPWAAACSTRGGWPYSACLAFHWLLYRIPKPRLWACIWRMNVPYAALQSPYWRPPCFSIYYLVCCSHDFDPGLRAGGVLNMVTVCISSVSASAIIGMHFCHHEKFPIIWKEGEGACHIRWKFILIIESRKCNIYWLITKNKYWYQQQEQQQATRTTASYSSACSYTVLSLASEIPRNEIKFFAKYFAELPISRKKFAKV